MNLADQVRERDARLKIEYRSQRTHLLSELGQDRRSSDLLSNLVRQVRRDRRCTAAARRARDGNNLSVEYPPVELRPDHSERLLEIIRMQKGPQRAESHRRGGSEFSPPEVIPIVLGNFTSRNFVEKVPTEKQVLERFVRKR